MRAGKLVDVGEEATTHGVTGEKRWLCELLMASLVTGPCDEILRWLIEARALLFRGLRDSVTLYGIGMGNYIVEPESAWLSRAIHFISKVLKASEKTVV